MAKKEGHPSFFCALPLQFRPKSLVLDILFFPPLCFANLRGPFFLYEIDVEKEVIKYKNHEQEDYRMHL